MWREAMKAIKSGAAPQLGFGVSAQVIKQPEVPTTAMGWRDHVQDMRQAQLNKPGDAIADHVGQHVASALVDNPDHQAAVAGAVSSAVSGQ
jgi:hypothetical protein